jgi:hypothetical protein
VCERSRDKNVLKMNILHTVEESAQLYYALQMDLYVVGTQVLQRMKSASRYKFQLASLNPDKIPSRTRTIRGRNIQTTRTVNVR